MFQNILFPRLLLLSVSDLVRFYLSLNPSQMLAFSAVFLTGKLWRGGILTCWEARLPETGVQCSEGMLSSQDIATLLLS